MYTMKKGTKRASPANLTRFMSTPDSGMKRLRRRPATKAPIIGSRPARREVKAQMKTRAMTKTNSMVPSGFTLRKKSSAALGMRIAESRAQTSDGAEHLRPGERVAARRCEARATAASMPIAVVSVRMTALTAATTERCRVRPSLETMG